MGVPRLFDRSPGKTARLAIVLAGIVLGQAVLYGPSLLGRKILLPLDNLAAPGIYLPAAPGTVTVEPGHRPKQDLVYLAEPGRRFAAAELREGRLPMWNPHQFAGAPFVWPRFSPFMLLECCTASPVILAWSQMLVAIVAGLGAYSFLGKALGLGFWPATIASWCYPLTGFFIFWQGYAATLPVCWLPWLLLAADGTLRPRSPGLLRAPSRDRWPIWLALFTSLAVVSGQLDIGAQVLVVSALYALWRLLARREVVQTGLTGLPAAALAEAGPNTGNPAPRSSLLRPAARLVAGWGLGLMLASPAVLPMFEYARTGARMTERSAGAEERPPGTLSALALTVLPDFFGRDLQFKGPNQMESASAGYAGVLLTLLAAPLAWSSRRHRSINIFFLCLAIFALSWSLGLPGFVQVLRMPGLRMLSHNRWVFAAAFAFTAMAAIGLDQLFEGAFRWKAWHWAPAGLLAALAAWSAVRALVPPEPFATQLERAILQGKPIRWVHTLGEVRNLQSAFITSSFVAALLCAGGFAFWLLVRRRSSCVAQAAKPAVSPTASRRGAASTTDAKDVPEAAGPQDLRPPARDHSPTLNFGLWTLDFTIALFLIADLLWFGYGRCAQCDPALYYARIPVLENLARVAKQTPGRMMGYRCLPANLATICGLRDLRGYDAVDPARLLELARLAAEQEPSATYARMQRLPPKIWMDTNGQIRVPPVLDMLSVRYLVFRDAAPPASVHPLLQGPHYWAVVNPTALDRVFVPKRAEVVPENAPRLRKLGSADFNPLEVAYVESAINLPNPCRGQARIVSESPTKVLVSTKMDTAGLVVLADLWDIGWHAYIDGKPAHIFRTNHALRGVAVPKGSWTLDFRYEPASLAWGLRMAGAAAVVLLVWLAFEIRNPKSDRRR